MIFNNKLLNIIIIILLAKIAYDYYKMNEKKEHFKIASFVDDLIKKIITKKEIKNIRDMLSNKDLLDMENEFKNTNKESLTRTLNIKQYSALSSEPEIKDTPITNIGPFKVLDNEKYYLSIKDD